MTLVRHVLGLLLLASAVRPDAAVAQETQLQYLSGTGYDDTVAWEFMVDGGRRAAEWSTIGVPSQWELEGFGTYNYGHDADSIRGKEVGHYRHRFSVPAEWRDNAVDIVFEGSMTDTEVRLNGESAGPIHQGGFYRFRYDVSKLLKYGDENLIEVEVRKHSADESVNRAERFADYWIFGGIFRPVYLEAKPRRHIERTAIDARADGSFSADVYLSGFDRAATVRARILTLDGESVGESFGKAVAAGADSVRLTTTVPDPMTWSAEYPNRYRVELTLEEDGRTIHLDRETFGFRTVEVRPKDGLYVNGRKVRIRGVNRHTFWPESGRTTSRALSLEDAELIKGMNMNAVRMSHYPPDKHFLEIADSVGLYILNELAGWQDEYDTEVGGKLVRALVLRDVNHPSVILWTNGNEGGFNFELEDDYSIWDPQGRTVLHPWLNDNGINTTHYRPWGCCTGTIFGGDDLIMPTEFLHGLYDGGHGAGLNDWWNLMLDHPLSVGGFLWAFADEAVVRTDKDGMLDTDGNHAPDGMVGPHREKEGSYFAIKEIWSPVYFELGELDMLPSSFDGRLRVENRYDFTNLKDVEFAWELVKFTGPAERDAGRNVIQRGTSVSPDVAPRQVGRLELDLPSDWRASDALFVTVRDPFGREIYSWTWMIKSPSELRSRVVSSGSGTVEVDESPKVVTLLADGVSARFDRTTGMLKEIARDGHIVPLSGPRLLGDAGNPTDVGDHSDGDAHVVEAQYDGALEHIRWQMLPSGWLKLDYAYCRAPGRHEYLGVTFDYPEESIRDITWLGRGPYRVWKNRKKGAEFDVHHKRHNDTVTGAEWLGYPEFKGFHDDLYWAVIGAETDLTIVSDTKDLYLRLFTPRFPEDARQAQVAFPDGDVSFLHGITPIGTKFLPAHEHGPEGSENLVTGCGGSFTGTLYFHIGESIPARSN